MRHPRTSSRFAQLTLLQEAPQRKGAPASSLSWSCPPAPGQESRHGPSLAAPGPYSGRQPRSSTGLSTAITAIPRNLPVFHPARSFQDWPIRDNIWARNPAFIAFCAAMGSSSTVAGQGRPSGASRQPVTKPAHPVRSGPGSEARPGVTEIKLSGGQFEAPNT